MARRRGTEPTLGLVLLRVVMGLVLVKHGWSWLRGGGLDGHRIRGLVEHRVQDTSGLVAWFGESVLLDNPAAIAFFWRWGALLLGVALATGTLTRPAGWLSALFLLGSMAYGDPADSLLAFVLAVIGIGCALGSAGRRAGLDAELDERLPGWLTWTARERKSMFLP